VANEYTIKKPKKMTYKCLIVDDEPIARKILVEYLAELRELELVGQLKSAIEVGDFLENNAVDILFLDINMPRLSGVQLLKNLKNPPLVIFTTAYSEYAVEAFALEAFDYLVKPIAFDRFLKAVNNAKKRLKEKNMGNSQPRLFTIKENKRIYKVDFEEIFLLQAYGDYVRIYTKEKKYLTKSKLNLIKSALPDNFLQVHRSYIINLNHLKYMEGNMIQVGTESVPVSLSFRTELMKRL